MIKEERMATSSLFDPVWQWSDSNKEHNSASLLLNLYTTERKMIPSYGVLSSYRWDLKS